MFARSLLILSTLLSSSALAAPTIDPQYGDHAVIQRGKPVPLSGTAAPGEQVTVDFGGTSKKVESDRKGRWLAEFPAQGVGGPLTIKVSAADGTAISEDLKVGDVWLCSGQSNMEYPLPRAMGYPDGQADPDPDLRLTKVPQQLADAPQTAFSKSWQWQVASPDVKQFSAACYFMVKQLRQSEKVPIGAIDDTWGGTPVRAWMSDAAVRASGGAELADIIGLYRKDPTAARRRFGENWGAWWRSRTGDKPGQEPWHTSDRLQWKPVPSLGFWDDWSPEWKAFDGAIWARKRVTLTPQQAAQPATLSMSAIDDLDETFVNGVAIGGENAYNDPRSYTVPKGMFHAGDNEILVYIRDFGGPGGFAGPADAFKLTFADRSIETLSSGWEYSMISNAAVTQPPTPPLAGQSGVSTIYNAMIAPLGRLPITGVAWYQGEADVGTPGYAKRLTAFMADWRRQFGKPDLPFLIVGLAGFGKPLAGPHESGWAEVINDQRTAVQADPRAALVSAIDLGSPRDIHPSDKQEVGHRLALAAQGLAYGSDGKVGPLPVSAARSGNSIVVKFTKPLQVLSSGRPATFELCGVTAGTCRYADARVSGNSVEIAGDRQPVTRVRYAWADYPIVNLYDEDLLPAPVFELPVQ
nr:9-O-acetylesterase [Sphingomonas sp.]